MNMQTPASSTVDRSMAAGCTSNKGHADTTAGQFTVIGGSTDWSRKDPARHRPLAAVRPVHGLQRARVPDWLLRVHSAMLSSWRSREMRREPLAESFGCSASMTAWSALARASEEPAVASGGSALLRRAISIRASQNS